MTVGSVVYRRSRRKPVLFFTVKDSEFLERTASGSGGGWRKLGGARNCLVVAVADGPLIVRPWFPFNLMFFPEILGLECDVPLANIESVELDRFLFRDRVRVALRDASGRSRSLWLFLARPDLFVRLFPAR